jgi:Protein of unknown function (DUF3489)
MGPVLDGDTTMARTAKTKSKTRPTTEPAMSDRQESRAGSKAAAVIALLNSKRGATIAEMTEVSGWQSHSVRGFLAGSLRKRHGLEVTSEKRSGEERRYRLC